MSKTSAGETRAAFWRFAIVLWVLAALLVTFGLVWHPYGNDWLTRPDISRLAVPLLLLEALAVLACPVAVAGAVAHWNVRVARWVLVVGVGGTLLLVVCGLLLQAGIGRPLFARETPRLAWTVLPFATEYVRPIEIAAMLGGFAAVVAGLFAVAVLVGRQLDRPRLSAPVFVLVATGCVTVAAASSLYEPIPVVRRTTGVLFPLGPPPTKFTGTGAEQMSVRASMLRFAMEASDQQPAYEQVAIEDRVGNEQDGRLPDLVFVIAESLRADAISPATMPRVHSVAETGLWCRNHFGLGNGSVYGFFGIVSGMDLAFFPRSANWKMAYYRLLREAGYHLVYTGDDRFSMFDMERYIRPELFDSAFTNNLKDWVEQDRLAIADAVAAMEGPTRVSDKPIATMVFLNGTHTPYLFEERDVVEPDYYEKAYRGFYDQTIAPRVRARYQNAQATLDRQLAPLLRPDRLFVLVGDHGEEFYESGASTHGTQLSHWQTMTACLIAGPGVPDLETTVRTSHSDLLPTVLDLIGRPVQRSFPWMGDSILALQSNPAAAGRRIQQIATHLSNATAVLGPWTDRWLRMDRPPAKPNVGVPFQMLTDNGIGEEAVWDQPLDADSNAMSGPLDAEFAEEFSRSIVAYLGGANRWEKTPDRSGEERLPDHFATFREALRFDDAGVQVLALRLINDDPVATQPLLPDVRSLARDGDAAVRKQAAATVRALVLAAGAAPAPDEGR